MSGDDLGLQAKALAGGYAVEPWPREEEEEEDEDYDSANHQHAWEDAVAEHEWLEPNYWDGEDSEEEGSPGQERSAPTILLRDIVSVVGREHLLPRQLSSSSPVLNVPKAFSHEKSAPANGSVAVGSQ